MDKTGCNNQKCPYGAGGDCKRYMLEGAAEYKEFKPVDTAREFWCSGYFLCDDTKSAGAPPPKKKRMGPPQIRRFAPKKY